jgi:hypothetical protein
VPGPKIIRPAVANSKRKLPASVSRIQVLVFGANARDRHHAGDGVAPDSIVRGFFVANGGIGVAIDFHQHELRAIGGIANHVEARNAGLPDAVAGIFERGGYEGIFRSGFNLNMNVNDMHIVSMMTYEP